MGHIRLEGITDARRRTLSPIRGHLSRRGFPPTVKDLEIVGISTASAHEQVTQFVRKGYLRRGATIIRVLRNKE